MGEPSPNLLRRVKRGAYLTGLGVFRRLPLRVRRTVIDVVTPNFTVGAVVLIHRGENVLFLSQPHRFGWTLPGGLVDAGEDATTAVVREVAEELGVRLHVDHPFTVAVNAQARRVDVIYEAEAPDELTVTLASEARDHRWIRPDRLTDTDSATRDILNAWQLAHETPRRGVVR